MPYHDEEYPGQPLWQSVLLFCCKGMIEGIMVILFFWLLVQVLFTKQLEVHLQILLLVGLIAFCLCLVLGCIMCWWKSQICAVKDKDPVTSEPAPAEPAPAEPAPAEPMTFAQRPPPSVATTASRQQYEELDGDIVEYPSTFTSPAPSEREFTSLSFSNRSRAGSEQKEQAKSYFSLRRLSTPPLTSPLYKPIDASHPSLPTFPKLGLLSKTCKALQRRCMATGDKLSYDEHSRLTSPSAVAPSMPEELIPLAPLSYGSGDSCQQPASPKLCLHFTMAFSPEQQTLAVTVLSLTGTPHRLEDVSVLGSLPPLFPCPIQASARSSLNPEAPSLELLLKVSSVKELQKCVLRIAVYTREPPSVRGSTTLGELEAECGGRDWRAEHPFHLTKELNTNKWKRKKQSLISQDALTCKGLSCPPQIFILLQYQALAHRIKATVLRADNLDSLVHTFAAAEYQVVINLHHEGVVISCRETEGDSCTVWNASFLFDLPPGDVSQLPLMLEFIIMQVLSGGKVLGRVLIGAEAADAGRAHWRDMCSLEVEQPRWHTVQPDTGVLKTTML